MVTTCHVHNLFRLRCSSVISIPEQMPRHRTNSQIYSNHEANIWIQPRQSKQLQLGKAIHAKDRILRESVLQLLKQGDFGLHGN